MWPIVLTLDVVAVAVLARWYAAARHAPPGHRR